MSNCYCAISAKLQPKINKITYYQNVDFLYEISAAEKDGLEIVKLFNCICQVAPTAEEWVT